MSCWQSWLDFQLLILTNRLLNNVIVSILYIIIYSNFMRQLTFIEERMNGQAF